MVEGEEGSRERQKIEGREGKRGGEGEVGSG